LEGRTTATLFNSFWQAGFEGADPVNGRGQALNFIHAGGHLFNLESDYAALARFGIRTVRESIGWRICEHRGELELNHVLARARAAERHRLQVVWTVWHFGIPHDLDYFSPDLPERFAQFCHRVARCLRPLQEASAAPATFVPINEISLLAWAVCNTRLMQRREHDGGHDARELKRHLVRAAVLGTQALRSELPYARFLHIDPIIHPLAPVAGTALAGDTRAFWLSQLAAFDMLCGYRHPELGGDPSLVDAVGLNYCHADRWEAVYRRPYPDAADRQRRTLAEVLVDAGAHCRKPLFIAETGHVGTERAPWLEHLIDGVQAAAQRGTMIDGICLYPAVDRPDWEESNRWHHSGLWDVDASSPGLERRLNPVCAGVMARAQTRLQQSDSFTQLKEVPMKTLLVFSHLRWDFVYQRPQQLLSRLAHDWHVVFVEEPVYSNGIPGAEVHTPQDNIEVLRLHTRATRPGFDDTHVPGLRRMVQDHLERRGIREYTVWFYTPMALPLLDVLKPNAIVYDCMDELSAFRNAPAHLLQREAHVLEIANIVFTGGPSLYQSKRGRNPNTWCFPSSVDAAHFARARAGIKPDARMQSLPRPRVGFFGVIDERLDLELLEQLARRRPDWQWCMVGPVVKIDPATLPQAPNLHYLPQQDYAELPAIIAAWDVCVLPFARNDATRFISPTKTLEYLAAGKPVVSTAIADVASLYSEAVWIANDADEFIAHCEAALQPLSAQRTAAMQAVVEKTSWARTAGEMSQLVAAQVQLGLTPEALTYLSSEYVVPIRAHSAASVECLILGAGPTGLSAAYHYGENSLLVECNANVGGWCRSINDSGFQFDHAGHIMFSNDAYVLEMYRMLLGDNIHWQNREAWVYSKNVYTRYPFQGALYGLPPDVLKECLVGAIEAHMGKLAMPAAATSVAAANDPAAPENCCGDAVGVDAETSRYHAEGDKEHDDLAVTGKRSTTAAAENFEQFIYRVWGRGVAKHFAIPYNRKLWTLPLSEMETSWLGDRVPLPDLEQMIDGALRPVARPMGPNARFGYPLKGGFQALMDGFLPHLKGQLALRRRAVRVQPAASVVHFDDGSQVTYQTLISTLPLPELIRLIGDEAPFDVQHAAAALRHVSIRCVNLGIGREAITDKHWVYYPEDTIFHRIFVQGNASPHCNPPGGFGLTCEISYSPHKPLPVEGDELIERCIRDCVRVGMIRADDPVWCANQVDMPYAYVVYDHARAENVAHIRRWLAERNIVLAGRYSEWEYYNSDHAFIAGKRAAESVKAARPDAISRIA